MVLCLVERKGHIFGSSKNCHKIFLVEETKNRKEVCAVDGTRDHRGSADSDAPRAEALMFIRVRLISNVGQQKESAKKLIIYKYMKILQHEILSGFFFFEATSLRKHADILNELTPIAILKFQEKTYTVALYFHQDLSAYNFLVSGA